jgi:hypothetical protein
LGVKLTIKQSTCHSKKVQSGVGGNFEIVVWSTVSMAE